MIPCKIDAKKKKCRSTSTPSDETSPPPVIGSKFNRDRSSVSSSVTFTTITAAAATATLLASCPTYSRRRKEDEGGGSGDGRGTDGGGSAVQDEEFGHVFSCPPERSRDGRIEERPRLLLLKAGTDAK